jgi:hypothetical protein
MLGASGVVFADAYTGTVFGRVSYRGYFDNGYDNRGAVVLPPASGSTLAIPNSVNTVGELVQLLRNAYNSGNAQRRTGAAFILNTMLGRDGPGGGRTISGGDWAELTQRLNARQAAGKIDWSDNAMGWINSYYQGHNDDAFYREYRNEAGIVFRDNNNRIVYQIIRRCANPIGDGASGLPPAGPPRSNDWSVAETSFIQKANAAGNPTGNYGNTVNNAAPGEQYFFQHRVYNLGPDALDQNIATWRSYDYPTGVDNNADHQNGGNGVGRNGTIRTVTGSTGVIPANAGGKQWCSRILADPRGSNNGSTLTGQQSCVSVPFGYNLLPEITIAGSGHEASVEQGATGTEVVYTVTNTGPTQSKGTSKQIIRFEVAPDAPLSSAVGKSPDNNTPPCPTHAARPGVTGCTILRQSANHIFNVGSITFDPYIHDTGDAPVGSRVCFVLAVNTPTQNATPSWRHSQPACVLVVKKPKVQVQGGDLWVGRQFVTDNTPRQPGTVTTGSSTVNGKTYGSWAEYGILATGRVTGMASGAALAGGVPPNQAVAAQISKLTFANRPSYGNYTTNPSRIPDYITTYANGGAAVGGTLNLNGANGTYQTGNNVAIQTSGEIPKGKNVIIHANNITINDDIKYADGYTNLADIPRIIIIADGNINISANVTRIDAWLITKNTLYTCSQAGQLTISICNKQLIMNGPVAAKEISLRRTFGSEAAQGRDTPGEIFNLRPDAILKAYEDAVDRGRAQTVYQVELPPRY